ncbi:hypothetical protein B0H13DRAFT_1876451 [Mycena leptocephala]|nr:hypothetical protein B0H13DRAFT_1876451 [Mycena leptocephala]
MGRFAHALENLAFSLSAVGNAEDAVRAASESVDVYRTLPDRTAGLEAGLANSLCSLAAFLRAVNRHEDASRADKEGADIYHNLAKTDAELTAAPFVHQLEIFAVSASTKMPYAPRDNLLTFTELLRRPGQLFSLSVSSHCSPLQRICVSLGVQRTRLIQIPGNSEEVCESSSWWTLNNSNSIPCSNKYGTGCGELSMEALEQFSKSKVKSGRSKRENQSKQYSDAESRTRTESCKS